MANSELNILNVVIKIKKCLVYDTLCAFYKFVANNLIWSAADRYILLSIVYTSIDNIIDNI